MIITKHSQLNTKIINQGHKMKMSTGNVCTHIHQISQVLMRWKKKENKVTSVVVEELERLALELGLGTHL